MPPTGTPKTLARTLTEAQKLAVCETVLAEMAEGKTLAQTVREVAEAQKLAVTPGTVRTWFALEDGLLDRYRRMKPLLGQAFAEEAVQIARDSTRMSNTEDKLLIETLRWAASKMAPMEFGDRQVVEHQGNQTLKVEIVEEEAAPVNRQVGREAAPPLARVQTARAVEAGIEGAMIASVTVPALTSGA